MASILLLGVKVPFTSGGQEALVKSLRSELQKRGHLVDTVELPFQPYPKEKLITQAAMWRSLDLVECAGQKVDLVIATKFPSYFAKHPRKSVWLVHQHRPAYDLFGTRFSDFSDDPRDEVIRRKLLDGDTTVLSEAQYLSGISQNVVDRLKTFHSLNAEVLYPPLPLGTQYHCEASEPYVLSVGRICSIKRIDFLIKALPMVHEFVKLKIAGTADEPGVMEYLQNEIAKHHLTHRVEFLGRVSDEELLKLYANCRCVYYAPFNEDYGYVTLEAFASSKPLVTAHDSGGVLEFARDGENSLIVEPTLDGISKGINQFIEDEDKAKRFGRNGHELIQNLGVLSYGWEKVIQGLLSPLN